MTELDEETEVSSSDSSVGIAGGIFVDLMVVRRRLWPKNHEHYLGSFWLRVVDHRWLTCCVAELHGVTGTYSKMGPLQEIF